jgi:hypothetical protein
VEHLGEQREPLIGRPAVDTGEELGHASLPAGIHLGGGHGLLRGGQIVGFDVSDQQAVGAQEQLIVVPAGGPQCGEHLGPHGLVPRHVFRDPIGTDL